MVEYRIFRELQITPTISPGHQDLPLLPINERQKPVSHQTSRQLRQSGILFSVLAFFFLLLFLLPNRLDFIKIILKLEPTSRQRKKSKKTGSQPIQGRSEQR